ncbi:MAG: porin [Pseudomonadota bacterium]
MQTSADDGFSFYGQLNYGFLNQDDGIGNETHFVNNTYFPSRFGVNWQSQENRLGRFKVTLETGSPNSSSSAVNQLNLSQDLQADFDSTTLRVLEVALQTRNAGTFSIGQGNMANSGIGYSDLSGTIIIAGGEISNSGGSQLMRFADGTLSTVRFTAGFGDIFGRRRLRLRYDTPTFSGFQVAASYGTEILVDGVRGDFFDAAVRYRNDQLFSGFDFAADAGYGYARENNDYVNASFALLHRNTGLNLHIAHGRYDDDAFYLNTKVGIIRDLFGWGDDYKTAVSVQYLFGDELNGTGTSINYTALSLVQNIGPSFQVYAQHALQDYNDDTASYLDADVTFLGVRYLFEF